MDIEEGSLYLNKGMVNLTRKELNRKEDARGKLRSFIKSNPKKIKNLCLQQSTMKALH